MLLRNVGILRLPVEEARLLWLCPFNIQYFMMKEIIKESCDVSMHSKIALNPRINVQTVHLLFPFYHLYIIYVCTENMRKILIQSFLMSLSSISASTFLLQATNSKFLYILMQTRTVTR